MRLILYYICQALLGLAFYNLGSLATDRLDYFEWGNSKSDGLYLLMVPVVLLPIILVASLVKYLVTKKMDIENTYKWSFIGSIVSSVVCTLFVIADTLWPAVILSILTVILIVIETIILSRRFLKRRYKIKT